MTIKCWLGLGFGLGLGLRFILKHGIITIKSSIFQECEGKRSIALLGVQ